MRGLRILLAVMLAFAWCGGAAAKDVKIGYIDSEKIFAKFKGTSDAQKKFDEVQAKWKEDAEKMKKDVEKLAAEIENQSLLLSEQKKKEKIMLYQTKAEELQKFMNDIWGSNGKAYRRNAELTKPIMDKINVILKKIGETENYTFVFDAAQGAIVYAEPGHDLSDKVLEELNKESE